MARWRVHLALFKENAIDEAAEAVARLRKLGVHDKDIAVLSGVPFKQSILDRPMSWTNIGIFSILGALGGIAISLLLNFGTPLLYPIRVGGMPLLSIPPTIVLTFELGMLGLMVATFIGVLLEMITPTYGPKAYSPRITDGYIGVVFSAPGELDDRVQAAISELGGDFIPAGGEVKP
jgi:hypothetical protein